MPCSPDPCAPNGYCNSIQAELTDATYENMGYFCRCKPGYTGINCQENINDCLNATCFNGGSCIDGINSYTCDCKWPFMGRYCQTQMKCSDNDESNRVCKNNGVCIEATSGVNYSAPRCVCKQGYEGADCSLKLDQCLSRPCLNNGNCVWLKTENDFKCECLHGFTGKSCQLDDVCLSSKVPCRNNSTCINIMHSSTKMGVKLEALPYYCQCHPKFTGINCDIKIWCSEKSSQENGKLNIINRF